MASLDLEADWDSTTATFCSFSALFVVLIGAELFSQCNPNRLRADLPSYAAYIAIPTAAAAISWALRQKFERKCLPRYAFARRSLGSDTIGSDDVRYGAERTSNERAWMASSPNLVDLCGPEGKTARLRIDCSLVPSVKAGVELNGRDGAFCAKSASIRPIAASRPRISSSTSDQAPSTNCG